MKPERIWSPITKEARRLSLITDIQAVLRTSGSGRYKRGYYLEEIGSFSVFLCDRRDEVIPRLRQRQERMTAAPAGRHHSMTEASTMLDWQLGNR